MHLQGEKGKREGREEGGEKGGGKEGGKEGRKEKGKEGGDAFDCNFFTEGGKIMGDCCATSLVLASVLLSKSSIQLLGYLKPSGSGRC